MPFWFTRDCRAGKQLPFGFYTAMVGHVLSMKNLALWPTVQKGKTRN